MFALDFSLTQRRAAQLLKPQQLHNSSILQPQQTDHSHEPYIMELDPNGYFDSYPAMVDGYSTVATECKHFVKYSASSASIVSLGRSEEAHSDDSDSEDEDDSTAFVSLPADTLLCRNCEVAIQLERNAASRANDAIRASEAGRDEELTRPTHKALAASQRYTRAAMKVANFEGRMADRESGVEKAREEKWEARKKVNFAVEEGQGAGEKPKEKKPKVAPIKLGWVEVDDNEAASTSKPQDEDNDSSYVFTYRPSIFTYRPGQN